jgi:hypothetical protein
MPVSVFRGNLDEGAEGLFGDFRRLKKAPNPKLQAPEKFQIPSSKKRRDFLFGAWCFFGA